MLWIDGDDTDSFLQFRLLHETTQVMLISRAASYEWESVFTSATRDETRRRFKNDVICLHLFCAHFSALFVMWSYRPGQTELIISIVSLLHTLFYARPNSFYKSMESLDN